MDTTRWRHIGHLALCRRKMLEQCEHKHMWRQGKTMVVGSSDMHITHSRASASPLGVDCSLPPKTSFTSKELSTALHTRTCFSTCTAHLSGQAKWEASVCKQKSCSVPVRVISIRIGKCTSSLKTLICGNLRTSKHEGLPTSNAMDNPASKSCSNTGCTVCGVASSDVTGRALRTSSSAAPYHTETRPGTQESTANCKRIKLTQLSSRTKRIDREGK
mmetsp:Transcript_8434/g.20997  ORF Transcript_8434/g.20997 Transcript_8434/m.20997 type:complete len:217 (-) Transcript_8434:272-922(-)